MGIERETSRPTDVDPQSAIILLKRLIDGANDLNLSDQIEWSDILAWNQIARDYLGRIFGTKSLNVSLVLSSSGSESRSPRDSRDQYYRSLIENKIKMIKSCIAQLEAEIQFGTPSIIPAHKDSSKSKEVKSSLLKNKRVFLVHGHNQGVKESVARFIEKLELEPVILHEKPNAGRTVIEKFSDYSDVHYAVVLLTGDDEGREKGSIGALLERARQNVIFEFGYFLGKLGRTKVCALYQEGVEIPSDYHGVLFIPFDSNGSWKHELTRELQAVGFSVDANRIIGAGMNS